MSHYKNKTAIVTGGASGIGRELCREMARRGATVVVADINGDQAERTAEHIRTCGGQSRAATLDVTDADAVKELIESTAEREGQLDFLFNNAGIIIVGEERKRSLEEWYRTLDVNLRGVVHGVHAGYRVMVRQGHGHIINTASLAGIVPVVNEADYVASKHAVVGLSQAIRAEGAGLGVKVSVVCPGFVETAMLDENLRYAKGLSTRFTKEQLRGLTNVQWMPAPEAAIQILRGVERNKSVIVITTHAQLMWYLYRLNHDWLIAFGKMMIKRFRALTQNS